MKYDNNWIKEKFTKDKSLDYIFFWGHQPKADAQISQSCFSQWFVSAFEHENIIYPTAEHWMMAGKAKLFNDDASFTEIIKTASPKDVKAIGRKVKGFDNTTWLEKRESIVTNGNLLKFKQHPDLRNYLDGTGDKIIVEASPYDKIWGIGMKAGDEGIENPNNWKGDNLLGYALMEVRDQLRTK